MATRPFRTRNEAAMIDGIPVIGFTAPAVLALLVLLTFRGDVLSRKVHNEIVNGITAEKDRIADERDEWKNTAKLSEHARAMQDQQILELLEVSRTTAAIVTALSRAATERKAGL